MAASHPGKQCMGCCSSGGAQLLLLSIGSHSAMSQAVSFSMQSLAPARLLFKAF